MHEMGIMQGILDASFEAAQNAGKSKISLVKVTIGELTEIQDYALEFAFEALTKDTMAEDAKLQFVLAVKVNSFVSPALQTMFCFSGNIGVSALSSSSEPPYTYVNIRSVSFFEQ